MGTERTPAAPAAPAAPKAPGTLRRRPPCRNFGGDERSKELSARIVQRSAQISALHREQLADIAEFDRAEAWRGDGAVSMIAWVTAQCTVSTSTARQWVRAATNLESLPCLAEGLATGALSLDLVEPLAEVASPSSDAALREASARWSVRQARELAAWHRARTEAEAAAGGPSAAKSQDERRTLLFNDLRQSVWVAFTKDDYAFAKSALVGRVAGEQQGPERQGGDGSRSGSDQLDYVPYDKRLYDALIDLFRSGSGAASVSDGYPGPVAQPRVVVHAPLELLVGCSDDAVAEIAGVGPVPVEVVRRLACDAKVDLAVEDRNGTILDQGRARRHPTPVQRIEIDRRDKRCRFPGCSYSEFTNVHHIRHWADGGLTNLDNLVTLCGRHHRAVHELGWSVSGSADAVLTFTGPHGRSTYSAPSPTWRPSAVIRERGSARVDRNGPLRR